MTQLLASKSLVVYSSELKPWKFFFCSLPILSLLLSSLLPIFYPISSHLSFLSFMYPLFSSPPILHVYCPATFGGQNFFFLSLSSYPILSGRLRRPGTLSPQPGKVLPGKVDFPRKYLENSGFFRVYTDLN